jgi:hypothetical protein
MKGYLELQYEQYIEQNCTCASSDEECPCYTFDQFCEMHIQQLKNEWAEILYQEQQDVREFAECQF